MFDAAEATERCAERLELLPRGGRPKGTERALSAKDEPEAQRLICGKFPDQLQLPFALWTRVVIRELMRVRFDVRLSIRGVGEYLSRWGYTGAIHHRKRHAEPMSATLRQCKSG